MLPLPLPGLPPAPQLLEPLLRSLLRVAETLLALWLFWYVLL
jgi:hypothetical protein